jgi:polysaccharide biosynthesis protein PslG
MNDAVSRRALLGGIGGAVTAGAVTVGALRPAPASAASGVPSPLQRPDGLLVGAQTHFVAQQKGYVASQLELLRHAGAVAIRDEVHWAQVEVEKDHLVVPPEQDAYVRAAADAGLRVLLILDYANPFYDNYDRPTSDEAIAGFTRYATFLANHFRGVVDAFEIWNEWDIRIGGGGISGPGDPVDYMRLVRSVYPALKAVDPGITVAAGAMTNAAMFNGFLDQTLAHGLLEHCDRVAAHPYNWGDLPVDLRRPEVWIDSRIEHLQAKLRPYNAGQDFPLFLTEMSWPTQLDTRGIALDWAAAYCARMYLLAATRPAIKGLWWYDLQNDGWTATNAEANFGLIRADDTPKPAFYTFAAISSVLADGRYEERLDAGDPDIWALRFSASNPRQRAGTLALWSSAMDDDWSVVLRAGRSARGRRVVVEEAGHPGLERSWGRREWYTNRQAEAIPDELEITLRRNPVLVKGQVDDVTITRVIKRPFPEAERPR